MTPMIFDIIILVLVLLSVALGFMRGFCNEVFTIFGWVAAIVATIYFTPVSVDYMKQFIEKEWLARIATAAFIFLLTLLICSVISYFATRTLHATKLGIVDRILGFGFGVVRAVVLLGLGFLLFAYVFSDEEKRPDFVNNARSKPFLEASANWMKAVLPLDAALGDEGEVEKKIDETSDKIEDKVNDTIKTKLNEHLDQELKQSKDKLGELVKTPEEDKKDEPVSE